MEKNSDLIKLTMNLGIEFNLNFICDNWLLDTHPFEPLKGFRALSSSEERFSYVMNLFLQKDPKLFIHDIGKNKLTSKDYREAGNKKFAEKRYNEAIQLYTKSVAFAPKHSQEQIIALGNRAATSLRFGYIPEALVDVQRALEMPNIGEDYKYKLEKRKEECMNRIIESKEPFKLSAIPEIPKRSRIFDSASDKVILEYSDKMGRFLSAGEDIVTGELLAVEKPYSCVLIPEMYYSHCFNCFLPYPALIECENCTCALYCSTQCLNKDKHRHAYICNILERLMFYNIDQISLLAMKTLIDATCNGNDFKNLEEASNDHLYRSRDFKRCYELIGNAALRSPMDIFKRSFIACTLVEALKSFSNFFKDFDVSEETAGGLLLHFHQSFPCNAHAIYNSGCNMDADGGVEIGAGAYAALSLINHSCDPNVARQCVGSTCMLRAIRPIKKGDEIFDNYGYHYAVHDILKRRASLMDSYYFYCQCPACVHNWPVYSKLPYKDPIFLTLHPSIQLKFFNLSRNFLDNVKKVLANKRKEEMLDTFCEYVDFLDSSIHLPWKYFNDCQETIKDCLQYFPTYQR